MLQVSNHLEKHVIFSDVTPELRKLQVEFEWASVEVHLQGAHVTSWIDKSGRENLFLSPEVVYESGVPIRGGIPIISPQFGSGIKGEEGVLKAHGYARREMWRYAGLSKGKDSVTVQFELTQEDLSQKFCDLWPYTFTERAAVQLGADSLTVTHTMINSGSKTLTFTNAFHNYFAVENIDHTRVAGLTGCRYLDYTREEVPCLTEDRDELLMSDYTNAQYHGVPSKVVLHGLSADGRQIVVATSGAPDGQLWNPWSEVEKGFADLPSGSYRNFFCYEPGNLAKKRELLPGEQHETTQALHIHYPQD